MLGIDALPDEGQYMVLSSQFERQLSEGAVDNEIGKQFTDNFDTAMGSPWTEDQFPLVVQRYPLKC